MGTGCSRWTRWRRCKSSKFNAPPALLAWPRFSMWILTGCVVPKVFAMMERGGMGFRRRRGPSAREEGAVGVSLRYRQPGSINC